MEHLIHVDPVKYQSKPPQNALKRIKWELLKNSTVEFLTPEEIVQAMERGQAVEPGICPAPDQTNLRGGTRKAYFQSQSLFMVDVDNDIDRLKGIDPKPPLETVESMLAKFKEEGLKPAFIIPSFSSEEWDEEKQVQKPLKFHCGFFADKATTKIDEATSIIRGLISLSPYADTIPSHVASIFFGTNKEALYLDFAAENKLEDLIAFGQRQNALKKKAPREWDGEIDGARLSHDPIPNGMRNQTLYRQALKSLKYHGPEGIDKARGEFEARLLDCEEPLEDEEIESIWNSAYDWTSNSVWNQSGYQSKESYDKQIQEQQIREDFHPLSDEEIKEAGPDQPSDIQTKEKPLTAISGTASISDSSKQQMSLNEKENSKKTPLPEPSKKVTYLLEQAFKPAQAKMESLLDEMNSGRYATTKTGITLLDKMLDGGLYPGLHLLGAETGHGKTTLVLQIADYIALCGRDVLYFSLEMGPTSLQARSISRLSFEKQGPAPEFSEVNIAVEAQELRSLERNSKWDQNKKEEIAGLIEAYGQCIAPRLQFVYGMGGITSEEIVDVTTRYIEHYIGDLDEPLTSEARSHLPVVIVDYLQILQGLPKQSDKEKIDKAVFDLKGLADDFLIPVIVISSFNRMSYKEPVDLGAFKESGGIEYTADTVMALQMHGMDWKDNESQGQRTYRVMKLKEEAGEIKKNGEALWLELKILKNRYGYTGMVPLDYVAKYNSFASGVASVRAAHDRRQEENEKARKKQKSITPF